MPLFSVTVYHQKTGQKKTISQNFTSVEIAKKQLVEQGYLIEKIVTSVDDVQNLNSSSYSKNKSKDKNEDKDKLKIKKFIQKENNEKYCSKQQKITLLQQWSGLLGAGVSLEQTLILGQKQFKGKTAFLLQKLQQNIQEGTSFNQACQKFTKDFDAIDVAIIAAGEQSGHLPTMMNRLAEYRYQQGQMKQSIIGAFIYPMIIFVVAIAVIISMMVFVLPQITEVFQQQHQQLPFLTRALLWASRHIIDYGFMILMMGGIVLGGFLLWVKSTSGQMTWHRYWALKSPVASLIREQSSSRFALTLSTLLAAQVPLVTALKQSATVINNSFLQSLIQQSSEKVQQGQSLSFSLGQTAVFPPLLVHLIANGEKTATLPQMLEKCAIQQEQMVKRQLHVLTTLLEPLMVVLFGGGVLILVLAILLPIIQLNNQI